MKVLGISLGEYISPCSQIFRNFLIISNREKKSQTHAIQPFLSLIPGISNQVGVSKKLRKSLKSHRNRSLWFCIPNRLLTGLLHSDPNTASPFPAAGSQSLQKAQLWCVRGAPASLPWDGDSSSCCIKLHLKNLLPYPISQFVLFSVYFNFILDINLKKNAI